MSESTSTGEVPGDITSEGAEDRIVIVGPDGQPIGVLPAQRDDDARSEGSVADLVEQPAKVMRIGSMIKQLLEEVRSCLLYTSDAADE